MADWTLFEEAKALSAALKGYGTRKRTISFNMWFALNDGKFADHRHALGALRHERKRKRLDLKWIIPNKNEVQLSYRTIQGRLPTPKEYCYGYLFGYIAQAVYPYWCYNVENFGQGSLIIEIENLKPMESVINIYQESCNHEEGKQGNGNVFEYQAIAHFLEYDGIYQRE